MDLYKILEIESNASEIEIKKAYHRLAKIHHPDNGGNNEMFQEITKAYEILFNKESRKEYDLYYLKRNMDEFGGDDLLKLKREHKNFINSNTKPISEEKLSELYKTYFTDTIKEEVLEDKELTQRIDNINLERETMDIEVEDDTLYKQIETNESYTLNDIFEYMKYKDNINDENKIVENNIYTLDTLPTNNINYYSLDNDNIESNLYSSISLYNELSKDINNVNVSDINEWKKSKGSDKKLSSDDIDQYINIRKQEAESIYLNVASELNMKKTSKFLNNSFISDEIQNNDNPSINNVRKREAGKPKEKTS
jgi:curved DNA-binding protein CbpA